MTSGQFSGQMFQACLMNSLRVWIFCVLIHGQPLRCPEWQWAVTQLAVQDETFASQFSNLNQGQQEEPSSPQVVRQMVLMQMTFVTCFILFFSRVSRLPQHSQSSFESLNLHLRHKIQIWIFRHNTCVHVFDTFSDTSVRHF